MSSSQQRIEILVDVFAKKQQRAMALSSLTPPELVEAILQEFQGDLDYLGSTPGDYRLLRGSDRSPLDEGVLIEQQVAKQEHLVLVEQEVPPPSGTRRPTRSVYVREQAGREEGRNQVYKLHWLPAVIGRREKKATPGELVAVDLAAHPTGLRGSRRHAQITEEQGKFYVEGLSQNPTMVEDAQGNRTPLNATKHLLHDGDRIYLERSQITLKFLIREEG